MNQPFLRKTVDYFGSFASWLLDVLFPIRCIGCGSLVLKHPYLCPPCFASLPVRRSSECIGCKASMTLGSTCQSCQAANPVDQLLIIASYDHPLVEKTIATYKYRFIPSLDTALSSLTRKYLHQMFNRHRLNIFRTDPVIVPVPLSRRRLNWRGFNQAELLAQRLGDTFQITVDASALERVRHTIPQVQAHDRAARLENLSGAFRCKHPETIAGQHIILIDDVCTTGTTLNECARVLKKSGAHRVSALVIARGS